MYLRCGKSLDRDGQSTMTYSGSDRLYRDTISIAAGWTYRRVMLRFSEFEAQSELCEGVFPPQRQLRRFWLCQNDGGGGLDFMATRALVE